MMSPQTIDAPQIEALFTKAERFEDAPNLPEPPRVWMPEDVVRLVQRLSQRQDAALMRLAAAVNLEEFRAGRAALLPRYRNTRDALRAIWRAEVDPSREGPDGRAAVAGLREGMAPLAARFFDEMVAEEIDLQLAAAESAFRLVPVLNSMPLLSSDDEGRDHDLKNRFGALTIWTEFHFNLVWLMVRNPERDYASAVVAEIIGACRAATLMYACVREGAELRGLYRAQVEDSQFARTDDDDELLSHKWEDFDDDANAV